MQALIRLRLLASELKQNELQTLIQTIIAEFNPNQILTFIFNHFVLKYNQTKQHDDDVTTIIQLISNILNQRKKQQKLKSIRSKSTKTFKMRIDSMPSTLIGECASYLPQIQFTRFSKCNRKIYIGCNSPCTLQSFYMNNIANFENGLDLNRFSTLKCIGISPQIFNQYMKRHPKPKPLTRVDTLGIRQFYSNKHQIIDEFVRTKRVHFNTIRHLTVGEFGYSITANQPYHFNFFCDFLSTFGNITSLRLYGVQLTPFDTIINTKLATLLPHLSALSVTEPVSQSVNVFRNRLLEIYSRQLLYIRYDERTMLLSVTCFPKLRQLVAVNPLIVSLQSIINNATDLENISFEFTLNQPINAVNTSRIMNDIFTKYSNLECVELHGGYLQMLDLMHITASALFAHRDIRRKPITFVFVINEQLLNNIHSVESVLACVRRMIDVLQACNMDHFMLGTHTVYSNDVKPFDKTMERLKEQHLVYVYNDSRSIIISNKDCTINGYKTKWVLR